MNRLSELNSGKLRTREEKGLEHRRADRRIGTADLDFRSFAQVVRRRPSFLKQLETMRSAFAQLATYLDDDSDTHFEKFDRIYEDLSDGWKFSYSSRWIAAMLDLAVQRVRIEHPEEVEHTCRIEKGEKTFAIPKA